jgi:hypothetical protein
MPLRKPCGIRPPDLGDLPRAGALCLPASMHLESGTDLRQWVARKTMLICDVVDQALHMIDRDPIPHPNEVCLECVQPQKLSFGKHPLFLPFRKEHATE